MKINREETQTVLSGDIFSNHFECIIRPTGSDSSDAYFLFKIDQGDQITRGDIEMWGPIERRDFLLLLKQIVVEIELLNEKH